MHAETSSDDGAALRRPERSRQIARLAIGRNRAYIRMWPAKKYRQAIHPIYCTMAQPVKDPQTEAHLPSFDQLRNNAAECIRLAEAARTSAHKSFFIEMADRWLTLAERAAKTQDR